ncbi:MAG: hypothetical protein ACI9D5_001991 [Candidatus Endobugula sp.]|jgi:hypothetical protein
MKSFIFIILCLWFSWHFTDIESSNFLYSALAPFGVFVFLCSLLMWLVLKAGFGGKIASDTSTTSIGTGIGGYFGGHGGDSGGDGGGC